MIIRLRIHSELPIAFLSALIIVTCCLNVFIGRIDSCFELLNFINCIALGLFYSLKLITILFHKINCFWFLDRQYFHSFRSIRFFFITSTPLAKILKKISKDINFLHYYVTRMLFCIYLHQVKSQVAISIHFHI